MSNYIQYVVCQYTGDSKKYLFYAPAFSGLKKGDEVLIDSQFGEQRATVLAVCNTYCDDVERVLRVLTGTEDKQLRRVIGKYKLDVFYYSEDENNE